MKIKNERLAIIVLFVPQLLEEWLTPVERFCECFKEVPVGKKERKAAKEQRLFFVDKEKCMRGKRNWYGEKWKRLFGLVE